MLQYVLNKKAPHLRAKNQCTDMEYLDKSKYRNNISILLFSYVDYTTKVSDTKTTYNLYMRKIKIILEFEYN